MQRLQGKTRRLVAVTRGALVAGVVAPFVMHSMLGLALASAAALGVGLAAWLWVKPRVT